MSAAERKSLLELITRLNKSVGTLVDIVLGIQVEVLLETLDVSQSSTHCLTATVGHVISLGLDGEYMCFIIARVRDAQSLSEFS